EGGRPDRGRHREQEIPPMLADDLVEQVLAGGGEDEPGQPAQEEEAEPDRQPPSIRPENRTSFTPPAPQAPVLYGHGPFLARRPRRGPVRQTRYLTSTARAHQPLPRRHGLTGRAALASVPPTPAPPPGAAQTEGRHEAFGKRRGPPNGTTEAPHRRPPAGGAGRGARGACAGGGQDLDGRALLPADPFHEPLPLHRERSRRRRGRADPGGDLRARDADRLRDRVRERMGRPLPRAGPVRPLRHLPRPRCFAPALAPVEPEPERRRPERPQRRERLRRALPVPAGRRLVEAGIGPV